MGTPELAATVLDALLKKHEVVGVFTRPDAVRGRGKTLLPSPVKQRAQANEVQVFTPSTLKDEQTVQLMDSLHPDVICVVAYGAILPKAVLDIPRYGCLNVHTSLLPRWRGAAPIERALLARDEQSGVCIMKMEEGLDTGPYSLKVSVPTGGKYVDELADELAHVGAQALLDTLDGIEEGRISWTAQGSEGLTYADKIVKGELDCTPDDTAGSFIAKVRASSPSHPSRLCIAGRNCAVERASEVADEHVIACAEGLMAGEATFVAKRLLLGVRDGMVEVQQLKPDGKKTMDGRSFAAGIQGIKNKIVKWGEL